MDVYDNIALKIIEQQEAIIGPLAIEQARHVSALKINWDKHQIDITGDEPGAIDQLVGQYEKLFGRISVEVCKDVTSQLVARLPLDKRPRTLR